MEPREVSHTCLIHVSKTNPQFKNCKVSNALQSEHLGFSTEPLSVGALYGPGLTGLLLPSQHAQAP